MAFRDKIDVNSFHKGIQYPFTSPLSLDVLFKPKHACAVKPEVLKSRTLEVDYSRAPCLGVDYSRAPCLGADQKTRGLWERDCFTNSKFSCRFVFSDRSLLSCIKRNLEPILESHKPSYVGKDGLHACIFVHHWNVSMSRHENLRARAEVKTCQLSYWIPL